MGSPSSTNAFGGATDAAFVGTVTGGRRTHRRAEAQTGAGGISFGGAGNHDEYLRGRRCHRWHI
jgi:hypothetical protein